MDGIEARSGTFPAVLGVLVAAATALSFVGCADRGVWLLESLPVLLGVPVLALTWRTWPLSRLLYGLVALHAVILVTGGHYTYEKVPLGEWARDWFGWARNDYDKLGHFAQGFMPAILTREILLRGSPFRSEPRSLFLPVLCVAVPLAFSALYEIFEWQVALLEGGADAFLGTQGDIWDTQSDMAFCLIGAVAALLLLSRWHDRSLRALGSPA